MNKGKVKWYDEIKGFGFIEAEGGNDIFVHRTGIVDSHKGLTPEQEVNFEIKEGEKGKYAVNVK